MALLAAFLEVAPYLAGLFAADCAVSVCDLEKVLVYVPGQKIRHPVKPGDPLLPASVVGRCIVEGKRVVERVGPEVLGVPYVARAIPVREGGLVVGGISVSEGIEREEQLMAMAQNINGSMQDAMAGGQELAAAAREIAAHVRKIQELSAAVEREAARAREIVSFIERMAYQTKILGLNAGIEAARLGRMGAGFEVVAREVRQLAERVAEQVKVTEEVYSHILSAVKHLQEAVEEIQFQVTHQTEGTEALAAALEEISGAGEDLVKLAMSLRG